MKERRASCSASKCLHPECHDFTFNVDGYCADHIDDVNEMHLASHLKKLGVENPVDLVGSLDSVSPLGEFKNYFEDVHYRKLAFEEASRFKLELRHDAEFVAIACDKLGGTSLPPAEVAQLYFQFTLLDNDKDGEFLLIYI